MKKLYALLIAIAITGTSVSHANDQGRHSLKVGLGLSTFSFESDSISSGSLRSLNGGFGTQNSAPRLMLSVPLEESLDIRMPVSLAYFPLYSFWAQRTSSDSRLVREHSASIFEIRAGVTMKLFEWNTIADFYFGTNVSASFVGESEFNQYSERLSTREKFPSADGGKEGAGMRLGGGVELGFEGHLVDEWFINCSASGNIINLMGRDDERGQLFSPLYFDDETGENSLVTVMFNFMVMYKL